MRTNNTLEQLVEFITNNKAIIESVDGLTLDILLKHLKEAAQYQKGYYKNGNGVYIYIKGIEVTNDTGNLFRMGYNGEDRGVWIHYCVIDDNSIIYNNTPIFAFTETFFNKAACKPEELMHPITKEDFESQVKKTIDNLCSEYKDAINVNEYISVVDNYAKLMDKLLFH